MTVGAWSTWYYLNPPDESGMEGGHWYYLQPDSGAMVTAGWLKIWGTWYHFADNGQLIS